MSGSANENQLRGRAHPEDAKDDEEDDLEEMPVSIVSDLEKHEFTGSKWIHGLRKQNSMKAPQARDENLPRA